MDFDTALFLFDEEIIYLKLKNKYPNINFSFWNVAYLNIFKKSITSS